MTTATPVRTAPAEPGPQAAPAPERGGKRLSRRSMAGFACIVVFVLASILLQGRQTLTVARSDLSPFQRWVNELNDAISSERGTNPILHVLDLITAGLNGVLGTLQSLFSEAPPGRPTPEVGWLGIVALAVLITVAVAGWRLAILAALFFGAFGTFGYWSESIATLIVTFVSVIIVVIVGLPLGLWMGNSRRATSVITPVLDVMQTLPSFVYLLPITLLFGIGGAPAVVATVIYALPPVVRVTAEGIRTVAPGTLEASTSLGVTGFQKLLKVQLPMARRTIIVGVNQSMMAALSMVTIAAFINSPGLGVPVISALASLDVGRSFTAGILIALMAILLDRVTTAAGERTRLRRTVAAARRRWILLGVGALVTIGCIYYSHIYLAAARFPTSPDLGKPVSLAAQAAADAAASGGTVITGPISVAFTVALINPFQALLASAPFWLVAAFLVVMPWLIGGWRAGVTAVVCLAVIFAVGIWHEAMVTLATALVGTVIVIVLALVVGVLMANSRPADLIIRPVLDTFQTIPAFVYLVPALALFGTTRFTAIVAAVIYGAPVAIKLVCDGIRGVSPTTIEAARSVGVTSRQLIVGVQLPMARSSVALAANQGLLYVFAVVVIGGLVGAGGLGYLVVAGFSQSDLFGKGMAAGLAIVALAILFDRTTQGWVRRSGS
ncbi:MAG TPA: ABC transporter permease subunit [Microlunatus sp.]